MPPDPEMQAVLRDFRGQLAELSERLEELEIEDVKETANAIRMLEYLKSREGGWATNGELRTLIGNGYVTARGALMILGIVETQRRENVGADGRGAMQILTRYSEGGVVGRISRKRILDSILYGEDPEPKS